MILGLIYTTPLRPLEKNSMKLAASLARRGDFLSLQDAQIHLQPSTQQGSTTAVNND
jgi:hypothetical protein